MLARAASEPVPLRVPSVRLVWPATVIVPLRVRMTAVGIVHEPVRVVAVPADADRARISTLLRLGAADRAAGEDDGRGARVEGPGGRNVQLLVVRMRPPVPARLRVPDGLLMATGGRVPATVVAAPVKVWAPGPSMSEAGRAAAVVEAWLMSPWAASVPVPLRVAAVRLVVPRDGQGGAGGDGRGRPVVDGVEAV